MDEEKKSESSGDEEAQVGPYHLQEQVPQDEYSRGELYRATHEESGATALVLKPAAEDEKGSVRLSDWSVRINSSASPSYVVLGWAIEVLFRDLKQLLGFSSSHARSRLAVLRTAPWVGLCYTLLVLWYVELGLDTPHMGLPIRPWYRTKNTVAFADILRLAQRTLSSADWVDPRLLLTNLRESTPPPQPKAA